MPLQPGDRIGRYVIGSLLGAGGMGEVYNANDPQLNRDVAIKMLTGETADDPGLRQRFEVEARAASTINHPNIVAVYDFGEQYGLLYIVWELVKGKTLRGVKFSARQTAELGAQMAEGLAAAHAAGIIHRDLKPENIIVTDDGRAKILDFGLAKRTGGIQGDHGSPLVTQSQPGMMMGTIGYMSPEQIKSKDVDARSDIFSLGLVLYEMVAGHRAFQGDSAVSILNSLLSMEPPDLGPELPIALRQIIGHCLQKNPELRYQSARDLAFALHALTATGVGTSGYHLTFQDPQPPWYKRRAFLGAIAGGAAASVGAFLLGRGLAPAAGAPAYKFEPLTFEHGFVSRARFASDGRSAFYSAGWRGAATDIFQTSLDASGTPAALGLASVELFAVSKNRELAVATDARVDQGYPVGSLARLPAGGGTPNSVTGSVTAAEWDPKGAELAIVRVAGNLRRLEYPVGKPLYETDGWIREPRFSPDGTKIAFIENPIVGDDRGSIAFVDLAGKRTGLALRPSLRGLAWAPGGKEVWFASSLRGIASNIEAAALTGETRIVLPMPGGISVEDIAADGRLLALRLDEPLEMVGFKGGDGRPIPLSWLESSSPRALSADGSLLVFTEGNAAGGSAVCIRKTDGTPPVRLGDGNALSLSDDGQRVLALMHTSPPQYVVYPITQGGAQKMAAGGTRPLGALYHPDLKRIVFEGAASSGNQLWIQDLGSGQARAISPAGVSMSGRALSGDGKFAAATGLDGKMALYPVEGGASRPVQGVRPTDRLIQWSSDSKSLFVYNPFQLPARIERVDPGTGKRELLREVMPGDPSGVQYFDLVMSADTNTIVLGLRRQLSSLAIVQGLK